MDFRSTFGAAKILCVEFDEGLLKSRCDVLKHLRNRDDLGGWDHRGPARATNVLSPITSLLGSWPATPSEVHFGPFWSGPFVHGLAI
jgi:hypothetical protein